MVNAANRSTIKFRHKTQNEFFVSYENSFLVLPDAKTVVGADALDKYKLMIEDITQGNPTQIGTHVSWIQTVLFDSLTQSLLVGDSSGYIKQYKKENQSFKMAKDYGKVGVDKIYSSTQAGRFAIFGGDKYSLVVIDIFEQTFLPGLLKSPFGCTYSLQVCEGVDSNFYLSLGGYGPKYSSETSDFLDVTLLYKGHIKNISKLPKDMNQACALLDEKDISINFLKLKIKQLESSLQKQVKQNKGTSNS